MYGPEDLLHALTGRLHALGRGDPGGVVDDRAVDLALDLLRRPAGGDPRAAARVAQVVIDLHRCRRELLRHDARGSELAEAVRAFLATVPQAPGHGLDAQVETAAALLGRGDAEALDQAVVLLTEVVARTPDADAERAFRLFLLGSALFGRFDRAGMPADLEKAITATRRAVAAMSADDHADQARYLFALCAVLSRRHGISKLPADLAEAVQAGRRAMEIVSDDTPDLVEQFFIAGAVLMTRYECGGTPADLDEAIAAIRRASTVAAGRPVVLDELGQALLARFDLTGRATDLDEALTALRRAGSHAGGSSVVRSNNLGTALIRRYSRTGAVADLDEAICELRKAADGTPPDRSGYPVIRNNLGAALVDRFERTGSADDLNESVRVCRAAAHHASGDDAERAVRLSTLAGSLLRRYQHAGSLDDLTKAVGAIRQAADLMPASHPDRGAVLHNLSHLTRAWALRSGSETDLADAVSLARQAVDTTLVGHRRRAEALTGLCTALLRRGEPADREEAVSAVRQAIVAASHRGRDGEPDMPALMSLLSEALSIRWAHRGTGDDLDEAVTAVRRALAATPQDHPVRARYEMQLGIVLSQRFDHRRRDVDMDEARQAWSRASRSPSARIAVRLGAARELARATAHQHGIAAAAQPYAEAVKLLPILEGRRITALDHRRLIGDHVESLGRDGAGSMIAADEPAEALGLLETGRCVVWAQLLDTRTDLSDLGESAPYLAARLRRCRDALEQLSGTDGWAAVGPAVTPPRSGPPFRDRR